MKAVTSTTESSSNQEELTVQVPRGSIGVRAKTGQVANPFPRWAFSFLILRREGPDSRQAANVCELTLSCLGSASRGPAFCQENHVPPESRRESLALIAASAIIS